MRPTSKSIVEQADRLFGAMRDTPVVRVDVEHMDLYAKLEYCNLVGSIKDRPALWILRAAAERGEIDGHSTIVESSSGNFAVALAVYCRMFGLDFIAVIDRNTTRSNEALLRGLATQVVRVEQRDDMGGFLKTRLAKVEEILHGMPNAYWTNQYGNRDGMMAHYQLTAGEVVEALPELDFVFIGVGSGGTLSGLSRRLKERFPALKVIAVDAEGSAIFGQAPRPRSIPGIGASIVPPLLSEAIVDDVVIVSELESVLACRRLTVQHRLFVGGSSGSAFHACLSYLGKRSGRVRPKALFLCADRGTAYIDTIYNEAWGRLLEPEMAAAHAERTAV